MAKEEVRDGSYFDGNTFQMIGYEFLCASLVIVTLTIAYPSAVCIMERWKAKTHCY